MKEYVCNDSCIEIITQAIDVMKAEMGDSFMDVLALKLRILFYQDTLLC